MNARPDPQLSLSERLTVIIPTFERTEMLARAIDSVLAQPAVPRILVVDDGSDPPARLHRSDARLSLVRLETNSGGAKARNYGAEQAVSPWITFLDDDDEWLSETGALYDTVLVDEPQTDLCYVSGIEVVDPEGKTLEVRKAVSRSEGEAWFLEDTPSGSSHLTKQTFVIPAETYLRIGGFDTALESRIHSEFALRLNKVAKIRALEYATYRLHKHRQGQVSKDPGKRHRSFRYIWRKHERLIRSRPTQGARWAQDHARRLFRESRTYDALHALWLAFLLSPRSAATSLRIVASVAVRRMR